MCMVAITFLNLIGIPMEIAFLDGNSGVGWEGFNVFSDTLFLIDVGLNFRMGIIKEDSQVRISALDIPNITLLKFIQRIFLYVTQGAIMDLKSIRQQYIKSWFIPDMVAAFPVGYILLIAVMCLFLLNLLAVLKLQSSKWKTCVLCHCHDSTYNTTVTLPHPEPTK